MKVPARKEPEHEPGHLWRDRWHWSAARDQALEEGYAVTMLVRNSAVFPLQHERLSLVEGDVRDRACVEAVVTEQDAVLSALGTNQRGPTTLCADGIACILTAMAHVRVRRLLVVSADARGGESSPHALSSSALDHPIRKSASF